jgi:hypothetical protein
LFPFVLEKETTKSIDDDGFLARASALAGTGIFARLAFDLSAACSPDVKQ